MTLKLIRANLAYLSYVLRHKYYVLLECFKVGLYWRGIAHDMSKFTRWEWFPYVKHFHIINTPDTVRDKTGYYKPTNTGDPDFEKAWEHHWRHNPHHWQYWVRKDGCVTNIIEMPDEYMLEMVCDWRGAGKAQGRPNTKEWYAANKDKLVLHTQTRLAIERILQNL